MTRGAPSVTAAVLTKDSRITLRPLAVVAEHDEYIVGDPAMGRFFAVPPPGLRVLRALRAGMSIGEAEADASEPDARVDALDFANTLLAVGFVTEVDGRQLETAPEVAEVPQFNVVAGWIGRALFSRPMFVANGLLLTIVIGAFLVEPAMRPSFEALFVHPEPAVSFGLVFGLSIVSGTIHELCHWWAARSLGVPARIRLSRRLYIPVMETDVTALWSLPAQLRYGPFLAGMVFDVLALTVAVALRLGWSAELIDLPPDLVRLLGAFVALKVFELMFQCLVFLRTDLYAVMITVLGVRNLDRVTRLRLKVAFRLARRAERVELADAHPRDLAVSRWYSLWYLVGLAWAVWFFQTWFYPSTVVVLSWMVSTIEHAPIGSGDWWQAVVVAAVAASNVVWPLAVFLRQRAARRGAVAT